MKKTRLSELELDQIFTIWADKPPFRVLKARVTDVGAEPRFHIPEFPNTDINVNEDWFDDMDVFTYGKLKKFGDLEQGDRFRFLESKKVRTAVQVGRTEIYCPYEGQNTMGHSMSSGEEVYPKSNKLVVCIDNMKGPEDNLEFNVGDKKYYAKKKDMDAIAAFRHSGAPQDKAGPEGKDGDRHIEPEPSREIMSDHANLLIKQFNLFQQAFEQNVSVMTEEDVIKFNEYLYDLIGDLVKYCKTAIIRHHSQMVQEPKPFKFDTI